MTSTTTIVQRLHDIAPEAEGLAQEALGNLVCIGFGLPVDSADEFDWFKAANDMADALGLPDPFHASYDPSDRPATSDTRPLYQRVEDRLPADEVHKAQRILMAMQALCVAIQVTPYADQETAHQLAEDFLGAINVFMYALGLPTRGEYDPAQHPTVGTVSGIDLAHAVLGVTRENPAA